MELFKRPNIDFIGWRYVPIGASLCIVVGSLAVIAIRGFNYGIEFTGGALLQVTFQKPIALSDIRSAMDKHGMSPEIQSAAGKPTYILRQKGSEQNIEALATNMTQALQTEIKDDPFTVDRREFIGPVVGQHLKQQTLWAICMSLMGIVIYIAFRFSNPIWGLAGLIAMFHDVIGAAGVVALTGKEMDLLIVSALLTVAGYSIEDTIVIYDRMREMGVIMRREPINRIIDVAINDTLSRTVITVLLVQIICLVLWLFGGEVLHNFALTLVVGNFLGSYSSIAVAAPLVYEYELHKNRAKSAPYRPQLASQAASNAQKQGANNQQNQNPQKSGKKNR